MTLRDVDFERVNTKRSRHKKSYRRSRQPARLRSEVQYLNLECDVRQSAEKQRGRRDVRCVSKSMSGEMHLVSYRDTRCYHRRWTVPRTGTHGAHAVGVILSHTIFSLDIVSHPIFRNLFLRRIFFAFHFICSNSRFHGSAKTVHIPLHTCVLTSYNFSKVRAVLN